MELSELTLKSIIVEAIQEAKPSEIKATMTIDEAAKFSGIGISKLHQLAHSQTNDFPSFKVGYRFLINREMFIEWLRKVAEEGRVL